MTMGKASDAALCSVSVSIDMLEQDPVLEILLKLVETKTHQVKVEWVAAASEKGTLSMSIGGSQVLLMQRNSILRSLFGAALHGAQDHHTNGCLSGRLFSVSASIHGRSHQAALNQASLTQWMSVADQLRKSGGGSDLDALITDLDQLLQRSAYVLPFAAAATLADLDLCVALWLLKLEVYPSSVTRWMTQVIAVLEQLASEAGVSLKTKLALPSPPSQPAPLTLFYGTEDADVVLSVLYEESGRNETTKQQKQHGVKADLKKPQESGTSNQSKQDAGNKVEKAKKEEKKKDGGGGGEQVIYNMTSLDIRVGKIINVWPHETADKLYCEEIDLGNGEIRQIASGLRPFYAQEDLQDRAVLVLCNLKKRTLVGFPSHGMVLCASNADHTAVEFVVPPEGSVLGERVTFEGLDASVDPEPETKVAKKKIFEMLAPDFKTDAAGNVVWKSHAAITSAGAVTALNKMANASVS